MIFDWTDGHTGKTIKLNQHDMAEMQTITAQCLNMERGISSDRKHLSAIQYKNQVEAEKAVQIQKKCQELEQTKQEGIEKTGKVREELEQTRENLKEIKTEVKVQKQKGAAADTGAVLMKAGTTVFDATTSLFNAGKKISYTGNLYDRERRKSYPVKNVKIDIAKTE